MRSFLVLSTAVLAVAASASASTPALRVPARVVPVYEETAAPGMPATYYPLCAGEDNSAFALEINDASTECAIKTSYDWIGAYLPTAAERRELCSCTQLIKQLQDVLVPRCSLYKSGQLVTYTEIIKYAFGLCNVNGGSSSTTSSTTSTPASTTATDIGAYTFPPTVTKSPYSASATAAPASTSASVFDSGFDIDVKTKKSKSKAPLIGGLIGGLAACAIIVFAVLRWRKNRSEGDDPSDASDAMDVSSSDLKMVAMAPLSPLDNSTTLTYPYVAGDLTPKGSSSATGSTTAKTF